MNDHELELIKKREFARGYESGQYVMDAGRYAVKLRLQRLDFDGGSHENLTKLAYAIYPCATGWTCESCDGLRDKIIELLGGVHDEPVPVGGACCSGDADCDCGAGEPWRVSNISTELSQASVDAMSRRAKSCKGGETIKSGGECDGKLMESGENNQIEATCEQVSVDAMSRRADQSNESSPMRLENETGIADELCAMDNGHLRTCPESDEEVSESAPSMSITDELREFKGHINAGLTPEMVLALRAEVNGIADRIDAEYQLVKVIADASQSDEYIAMDEYRMVAEKCDELRAKLDEADAAIANWREREKSFAESERLREELRRILRKIAEQAGVPHDRDFSEYSYGKIANAVIGQLGETKQYVKSLEWVRDRRLPKIEAKRDELLAKLDEYDETHIELPKDKDGNRVTIGNTLHDNEDGHDFIVCGFKIWDDKNEWWAYQDNGVQCPVKDCTLVRFIKPDPIESLVTQHTLGNLTEQELIDKLKEVMKWQTLGS